MSASSGFRPPAGYVLVPSGVLQPARSRSRRVLVLLVVAFAVVVAAQSPKIASADTVTGRTTGTSCLVPGSEFVAYTTSTSAGTLSYKAFGISARLRIFGYPALVEGRWELTNGASSSPKVWAASANHVFADGSSFNSWVAHSITLQPGTSATLRYVLRMPEHFEQYSGDDDTVCFTVQDTKVDRTLYANNVPQTAAPGGGGFAPTPTPAATPTAPTGATATPIPGATPGPGVTCYTNPSTFQRECLPNLPSGWCWRATGLGAPYEAVQCNNGPTMVPGATAPPANNCAGMQHTICREGTITNSVGGQGQSLGGFSAAPGESWRIGGWMTITCTGSCGGTGIWYLRQTGCSGNGSNNPPMETERFTGVNGASMGVDGGAAGNRNTIYAQAICSTSAGTYSPSITTGTPCGGSCTVTWSYVIFWDKSGTAIPQASPTGQPAATLAPPTTPPNYWPGGAPPDINVDVDVDVDICEDDPNISACQTFPPGFDVCEAHPTIAACATPPPGPTSTTAPGGGGSSIPDGNGNGLVDCDEDDDMGKPGMIPTPTPAPVTVVSIPIFGNLTLPLNPVDAAVAEANKVAIWANNTAINLVVPGECVGELATGFADLARERVPFSFYFDVRDALAAPAGAPLAIPPATIGGASIDVDDALAEAGAATAPYRGLLALIPWLIGVAVVTRIVVKTVGSDDGG